MQTSLRIDMTLYREAKAAAASEGVTLTRYIESALRMRLRPVRSTIALPLFDSGVRGPADVLALISAADRELNDAEAAAAAGFRPTR